MWRQPSPPEGCRRRAERKDPPPGADSARQTTTPYPCAAKVESRVGDRSGRRRLPRRSPTRKYDCLLTTALTATDNQLTLAVWRRRPCRRPERGGARPIQRNRPCSDDDRLKGASHRTRCAGLEGVRPARARVCRLRKSPLTDGSASSDARRSARRAARAMAAPAAASVRAKWAPRPDEEPVTSATL